MITSIVASSILLRKSNKNNVEEIYRQPLEWQVGIFKATLTDLEEYLDTGDLTKINSRSLGIIKADCLNRSSRTVKSEYAAQREEGKRW